VKREMEGCVRQGSTGAGTHKLPRFRSHDGGKILLPSIYDVTIRATSVRLQC
jgi:hypothetical protein